MLFVELYNNSIGPQGEEHEETQSEAAWSSVEKYSVGYRVLRRMAFYQKHNGGIEQYFLFVQQTWE